MRALIGRINMARSTGQMFTAHDTNNYRVMVSWCWAHNMATDSVTS